jgi:type II secretory pathway pseudopilin PulG
MAGVVICVVLIVAILAFVIGGPIYVNVQAARKKAAVAAARAAAQEEREREERQRQEALSGYESALQALEADPANARLRVAALEAGRRAYPGALDEPRIANDIKMRIG